MATDYSIYKARAGSKVKLSQAAFFTVLKKHRVIFWQRSRDFNSAWKWCSNKDWPRPEYGHQQKYSSFCLFVCRFFFLVTYNSKCSFEGNLREKKCSRGFQRCLESVPTQIFSHDGLYLTTLILVIVYSSNLEQISVHLLTHIHDSGKQGRTVPLTRHLITDGNKEREELGVLGQCQWSKPGGYGAKHHPANGREAWLSRTTQN